MTTIVAQQVWTPEGCLENGAVDLAPDGRTVLAVRSARPEDGEPLSGLLIPGLCNAHLHLELSWLAGKVPRSGQGFAPWVKGLLSAREAPIEHIQMEAAASQWAQKMRGSGTALVCDISNHGWTAPHFRRHGLAGIVQRELVGFAPDEMVMDLADAPAVKEGGVVSRPTSHALYSTHPDVLRKTLGMRQGAPSTMHLAEDQAELDFLRDGSGPYGALHARAGVDWRSVGVPGCGPVAYLDRLGVLGPGLLAVHGVCLSQEEQHRLAQTGTPLCLCPRSNRWIGGELPDVLSLIEAGVTLCLGTDSLASNDDLDVLGEIPELARSFPEVPVGRWLDMATRGGARALQTDWGEIVSGQAPGLVLLEGVEHVEALADGPPATRRWIALPGDSPWGKVESS